MSQDGGPPQPKPSQSFDPLPDSERVSVNLRPRAIQPLPDEELEMRVRREILDYAYGNGMWLSLIGLMAAVCIYLFVADFGSNWMTWLGLITIATLIRFSQSHHWLNQRSKLPVASWEWFGAFSSAVSGIAWGLLTVFLNTAEPMVQVLCALIMCCNLVFVTNAFGVSRLLHAFIFVPLVLAQGLDLYHHQNVLTPGLLPLWMIFCSTLFISHWASASRFRRRTRERILQERRAAEQRVLLNTVSVGVLVTQHDIILDCNERYLNMYGYQREQLIGQSTRVFMISEAEFEDSLQRNSDFFNGKPVPTLARRKRADGSVIDVEIRLGLVDPNDPESAVVGVYEDVTERLTIERELRDSQARFRMALDSLQSGVWDYDLADENYFNSRRFMQILGYDEDARLEPHLRRIFFYHDWIVAEDQPRMKAIRSAFLNHGQSFDEQYRLCLPHALPKASVPHGPGNEERGPLIWVRETVRARHDESGRAVRYTGSLTDITANNEVQEQLRESERLYRSLVDTVDSLIWHTDAAGVLTFVNARGARSLYGYEPEEMIGRKVTDFVTPESLTQETNAQFAMLRDGVRMQNNEVVHFHKNGRRIYLSVNAVAMFDDDGAYTGLVGINTNITPIKKRQRAFQEAVRLQRLIFDSAGEGIVIVRNGRVFRANQAFVDLIGATLGDVIARPLATWFDDAIEWQRIETQLMTLGNVIKVEQVLRCVDGRTIWVLATGRQAEIEDQMQAGMIWVFSDISAQKRQEEQSWYRANHDELTGLPNRRMLQDRLEQALGHARRESTRVGLLMLDLDGFKVINDTHGHHYGDEMLRQAADRMSSDIRQLDTVARMGGDEFVIVLHNVDSLQDIEIMAQRLIERVRQPMTIEGQQLSISTSIGISMFPDSDESLVGLLHAADMAMYAAKASGKNAYRVAEPAIRSGRRTPLN